MRSNSSAASTRPAHSIRPEAQAWVRIETAAAPALIAERGSMELQSELT
jgi:hypothetical protein